MLPMKLFKKKLLTRAIKEFGRLDFAVNNAGISPWVGTTAECSFEDWKKVIDINLTGTWLGMKYQIPAMIQAGGGVDRKYDIRCSFDGIRRICSLFGK